MASNAAIHDHVNPHVITTIHMFGGLPELGHADIMVSDQEWQALQWPLPELRGFLRSHIDLPGLRWHRVRMERLDDPDLAPFDAGHVPGAGNKAQMRKAVAGVNAFRQRFPDLTVLAAHDPSAANRLTTSLNLRV